MALAVYRGTKATRVPRGPRRGHGPQAVGFACERALTRISRPPPAASDFRTLGRRAAEIRTWRLAGVGTGLWNSRARRRGGAWETAGGRVTAPLAGPWGGEGQACTRPRRALACRLLSPVLSGDVPPCTSGRSWTGDRSHGQIARTDAACRDPGSQGWGRERTRAPGHEGW
jgi:hypothetical protein